MSAWPIASSNACLMPNNRNRGGGAGPRGLGDGQPPNPRALAMMSGVPDNASNVAVLVDIPVDQRHRWRSAAHPGVASLPLKPEALEHLQHLSRAPLRCAARRWDAAFGKSASQRASARHAVRLQFGDDRRQGGRLGIGASRPRDIGGLPTSARHDTTADLLPARSSALTASFAPGAESSSTISAAILSRSASSTPKNRLPFIV
jgi:hypothetical protein